MLRPNHHARLRVLCESTSLNLEDLHTILYPMRFIGLTLLADDMDGFKRVSFLLDERAEEVTQALRANDRKAKADILREATDVLAEVSIDHRGRKRLELLGRSLGHAAMIESRFKAHGDKDTGNSCYAADKKFTNTIKNAVLQLRTLLVIINISKRSKDLQERVWWLLRLDIQLRITPTAGKCERLPWNVRLLQEEEEAKRKRAAQHAVEGCMQQRRGWDLEDSYFSAL